MATKSHPVPPSRGRRIYQRGFILKPGVGRMLAEDVPLPTRAETLERCSLLWRRFVDAFVSERWPRRMTDDDVPD